MPALPRQMLRHSSVSVAPAPSPANKPPLEKNEMKKRDLPAARRYCTYELDWNDYRKSEVEHKKDISSMNTHKNSASNATNLSSSPRTHLTPHHQTPPKERISENFVSPFGGITVTIVQKVEVKASPDHAIKRLAAASNSKIPRPINSIIIQRKDRPVQISSTRIRNDQRPVFVRKINSFDISNRQVFPGLMSNARSNFMVNAPTANPENSNDPTDMEDEDSSSPTVQPAVIVPKLLHTALVPLEQYRKNKSAHDALKSIVLTPDNDLNLHPQQPSSHVSSKQKMRRMLPSPSVKRASQIFRQRLLEQSVSMSLASSVFNSSISVMKHTQDAPGDAINLTPGNNRNPRPRKLSRANSKRKRRTLVTSPSVKFEPLPEKNVPVSSTSPEFDNSTGIKFTQNVKRPSQIFRQHLLEQSVSMSLTGSGFSNLVNIKSTTTQQDVPKSINNLAPINNRNLRPRQLSRVNSRRKRSSVLSSNVKRESQIFRQQLLEQSVSMSLDGSRLKNPTNIIKPAQDALEGAILAPGNDRNLRPRQLSRVNYKRKGSSSISSPAAKRASQIFRQRLLEQSVSMSLSGSGQNSSSQSKLPIRRLSRKSKDRRVKKERENGKNNANLVKGDNERTPVLEKPKVINVLPMSRILESEELSRKVDQEIQRQARLKPPQPPPRNVTHNLPAQSFIPTSPGSKNNSSSLISLLPERKIPRSLTPRSVIPTFPRPISIDPFPTHLSHRSIMKIPFSVPLRVAPMF